ncbi:MAG: hypothetical protein ACI4HO_08815 [Ruminococcus sp.]
MSENIWERQPGETVGDYKKFCVYRDMGAGSADITERRSLQKAADVIKCRKKRLEPLSKEFRWVERAEAYDVHLEKIQRQKHEAEIEKMKEGHAKLAQELVKKAALRLLTIPEDEIKAADVVRMFETGVKIERLSRGESTENQRLSGEAKVVHSGKVETPLKLDLSQLNDEELKNLESLLTKLSD